MSLITAEHAWPERNPTAGTGGGEHQTIRLPRLPGDDSALLATMARRTSSRPGHRAVLYVHCLSDPYVQPDLATWYLQRGFGFYVADLRTARPRGREATLTEYLAYLDAAVRLVRDADGNKTVLVSAHRAGAVIAALWCHTRRAAGSPDALIMADPDFGPEFRWLHRLLGPGRMAVCARQPAPGGAVPAVGGLSGPVSEVLPQAQRRLRRGLDIACPVLVMSPSAVNATARGPGYRAGPPARLGPHVTALRLASAPPGLARPDRAARRCLYDELSRWLGAYLSAEIRDQLLLAARRQRPRGQTVRPSGRQVTVTLTWG